MFRCAAPLVLALVAICEASASWTFGRHFGTTFRLAPLSYLAAPLSRYSTANVGFHPPARFRNFHQRITMDTPIIADENVDGPVSAFTMRPEPNNAIKSVSFGEFPVVKLPANVPPLSLAFPSDSPVLDATKSSSALPESTSELPAASPSETETTGSPIFFPDQLTPLEPKTGDVFVPECDGVPFMARNRETGRCQFLMMRTECPEGQWFILDRDTLEASCRALPCPEDEVLFDGVCRLRNDAKLCPEGMVVLLNEYGDASCDCAVKHLYWPAHDRCYPAYRKGPCHTGEYLTVGDDGEVRCSDNLCLRDGSAFWRATKRCFRLQDETDSPCLLGRLDVNEETLHLECIEAEQFGIFDLPVVRCSKGSKLDYRGRCKRELYQKFRSSFTSSSSRKRKCGEGFIVGLSGRCLKAANTSKLG